MKKFLFRLFFLILILQCFINVNFANAARIDEYTNVAGANATGNDEFVYWDSVNSATKNILFSEFVIWLKANGLLASANPTYTGTLTATKASGVAGDIGFFESTTTETNTAGFRGPDSLTYSYRGKFPGTRATGTSNILLWTNSGETGNGTTTNPYIQIMAFYDLAGKADLNAPVFTTSIETPFIILGSAATAADAGIIRLPNAAYITAEADAAGTDISVIGVDSAEIVQIAASGASGVTITPDTTITGDLTVSGADVVLLSATAGARITGGNGLITFKGEGDGTDEDLTINLNSSNVATVSSSTGVTQLGFSALNLVTTGTIQGGVLVNSDANGMSKAEMTAVGAYGTLFVATGAGTWILPTAVAGMSACVADSGTAHDLIVDVADGDVITFKGAALTANLGVTNASGSTTGDFICFVATAAGQWMSLGMQGTWASQ